MILPYMEKEMVMRCYLSIFHHSGTIKLARRVGEWKDSRSSLVGSHMADLR